MAELLEADGIWIGGDEPDGGVDIRYCDLNSFNDS